MKTYKHGHSLTPMEKLRALIGLGPSAYVRRGMPANAWTKWDLKHGPSFRAQHGLELPGDGDRLARDAALAGELPSPPGV